MQLTGDAVRRRRKQSGRLLIDNWRLRGYILWLPCKLRGHPPEFYMYPRINGEPYEEWSRCNCGRASRRKPYRAGAPTRSA